MTYQQVLTDDISTGVNRWHINRS